MGRDGIPAREISFVSLMAYGPNSDSALIMGGYSLWNQGREVGMAGVVGKSGGKKQKTVFEQKLENVF